MSMLLRSSSASALRRQLARGREQRPWARSSAAKAFFGAEGRAAVEDGKGGRIYGVGARAGAAVKDAGAFSVDARAALLRSLRDSPDATLAEDGKGERIYGVGAAVKDAWGFSVDARAALLRSLKDSPDATFGVGYALAALLQSLHGLVNANPSSLLRALDDLADAVKSGPNSTTDAGTDMPSLNHFANAIKTFVDLQGRDMDDPSSTTDGSTIMASLLDAIQTSLDLQERDCIEGVATYAPLADYHCLATRGYQAIPYLQFYKAAVLPLGKSATSLSIHAPRLKGPYSQLYTRGYTSLTPPPQQQQQQQGQQQQQQRKEEELFFLVYIKEVLNMLKSWRASSHSKWKKLEPQQRYFYQLLVAVGCLEVGCGLIIQYSHNRTVKRLEEKFAAHKDAISELQKKQEEDFSIAEGLAAEARAKESSQRSAEAAKRSTFAQGQLGAMGTQMYMFQTEIAEIKQLVQKLAKDIDDKK